MSSFLVEHKFSDLYDIASGISSKPAQAGHGAPFLSFKTIFNNPFLPNDLTEYMDTSEKEQEIYSIKKGDVFLTRTSENLDELAISSVAPKDYPNATFSGFAKRLRPVKQEVVYDLFMGFFLRSSYFRKIVNNNAIMTLRASFNEAIFSYIKILLPNYTNQKKIGDLLHIIYQKIEQNNHITAQLEKMARTLYDYWFVQFDFPDENKRPYKSAGGEMVFNTILNREIPKGWEVENLADNPLTDIIKPGIKHFDGQKIYLPTAAIEGDKIVDTSNLITFDNREGRANMQPAPFSVWFAKMKNTCKVLYFGDYSAERIPDIILSTGMLGLQTKPLAMEYVWGFVNNARFEAVKNQLSHGATQEGVNNADLEHFPFLVPAQDVLKRYSALVGDIYQQKYLNEQESERLAQIRDFLLPMLMNEQVSV